MWFSHTAGVGDVCRRFGLTHPVLNESSLDSSAKLSAEVSECHQSKGSKAHPGRTFYLLPEKAERGHPEQLQRQAKLECLCVTNCETCSASAITVAQSATLLQLFHK